MGAYNHQGLVAVTVKNRQILLYGKSQSNREDTNTETVVIKEET
jgi:hypothetical protein